MNANNPINNDLSPMFSEYPNPPLFYFESSINFNDILPLGSLITVDTPTLSSYTLDINPKITFKKRRAPPKIKVIKRKKGLSDFEIENKTIEEILNEQINKCEKCFLQFKKVVILVEDKKLIAKYLLQDRFIIEGYELEFTSRMRIGPDNSNLCNSCGINYRKIIKEEKKCQSKSGKISIDQLLN